MILDAISNNETFRVLSDNFFLGGDVDHRKMSWVKWDLVLPDKSRGGLKIGSLIAFNCSLLQKWRWHFLNNEDLLSSRVVKAIYGGNGGLGLGWERQ